MNQKEAVSLLRLASHPRRIEFNNYILAELRKFRLLEYLRGSFLHGNFHYDLTCGKSFSDIDLIGAPNKGNELSMLENSVQTLSKRLSIKISMHEEDHLTAISLKESHIKNILEFCILTVNESNVDRYFYHVAKTILLLSRSYEDEHNVNISSLPAVDPPLFSAMCAKHGFLNRLDNIHAQVLIDRGTGIWPSYFMDNFVNGTPSVDKVEFLLYEFENTRTISSWLKQYIFKKLISATKNKNLTIVSSQQEKAALLASEAASKGKRGRFPF